MTKNSQLGYHLPKVHFRVKQAENHSADVQFDAGVRIIVSCVINQSSTITWIYHLSHAVPLTASFDKAFVVLLFSISIGTPHTRDAPPQSVFHSAAKPANQLKSVLGMCIT